VETDARAELERIEASAKPTPTPVHTAYGMAGDNRVWVGEDGTEHDALLFKVDLKRDEMRFYHLQLVYEANKDLFVLFTRWGEIGETGAYQRTPQASKDDAIKDFGKVFKEKTGNSWGVKEADFERKPNKYQLLKRRRPVARDELLRPLHPAEPSCSLPRKLRRTVDSICDPRKIGQALTALGIKTESMPFGSLSRSTLEEAKGILGEIRVANGELRALRSAPVTTPEAATERAKTRNAVRERVLDLSSRYYELVPRKAGVSEVARPLESDQALQKEFEALLDLAEASVGLQVLLGAYHHRQTQHPLDYCLRAFGVTFEEVDPSGKEFDLVLRYAQRTCEGAPPPQGAGPDDLPEEAVAGGKRPREGEAWRPPSRPHDTITAVYRLARSGEGARFEKCCGSGEEAAGLRNRRLLWHGSRLSNIIGILSQGLRVAPPEAPVSGYMFGKGIYLADMYSKSRGYCSSGSKQEPAYMLLCEAALGEMFPCRQAMYMDQPQQGTSSTWGVGRKAPDWTNRMVEPGGAAVPAGAAREAPQGEGGGYSLNYNEFIVYDTSQIRSRYLIELEFQYK
jgi:predicted DNA-binding WGR domain protein